MLVDSAVQGATTSLESQKCMKSVVVMSNTAVDHEFKMCLKRLNVARPLRDHQTNLENMK